VLKFLLVVVVFAALVYALMGALERRRVGGSDGGSDGGSSAMPKRPRRGTGPQPRQAAPDDDEDFLRWLDRKRKKDSPDQ
jgi:hypothetical protein